MTSIFDENGKNIPCTVLEAGPCVVTQVRTEEVDGYSALQLGFDDKAEKRANKAETGHFKKAGASPKKKVVEFRDFEGEYKLGDTVGVDLFVEGEFVDVIGTSKGKGFQGVVKRHGFGGVGQATHGQHNRLRAPWFYWSGFLPCPSIQRNAYGWKNGRRTSNSSKPKSIESGS